MLDLEDSVPPGEKDAARRLIPEAARLVARGGGEVLVRINHDAGLLLEDLQAAVHPGLDGICYPKAESAEAVARLDGEISRLERAGGIAPGQIALDLLVESPRGLLGLEALAAASPRVRTMTLGPEDYCLELGVEPSADGLELLYGVSKVVTVCRAARISPMGLLGSIANFQDLYVFERGAIRARDLGCVGASCIHPNQVTVLNRVFSPAPYALEFARTAVEAFEEGLRRGTASVSVAGMMVDTPVYRRARRILEQAAAVAAVEKRKADALARLG